MVNPPIPEFKVILVGEYGVGKTSIFRRFLNDSYLDTSQMSPHKTRQSTIGLDQYIRTFEVNGSGTCKQIRIQLWDTGGLERVASITNSYYKFSDAALLVFSLASLESFHSLSQHLLEIFSMAETAKVFLVGNKVDIKVGGREVSPEDVELFLEQFTRISGYFEVSAKTNEGIAEMFDDISEKLAVTINLKTKLNSIRLHHSTDGSEGFGGDETNATSRYSCCS